MWSVEHIDAIPVELDFSSSGQGQYAATAIESSGVRLINAIELVDVEPGATQVEVCEGCGFGHCSPGGWVAFRRLGDRVVWIPAWSEMEKGAWEAVEYTPPSFFRRKGAPIFGPAQWDALRALHGGLPACHELPWIDSREAARLCQWTAPARALGEFPEAPRLRRTLLLAVTDGDLAAEADAVDSCLRVHVETVQQLGLVPDDVALTPIEFWLDLPGAPGWVSFAHAGENVCFLLGGSALMREAG